MPSQASVNKMAKSRDAALKRASKARTDADAAKAQADAGVKLAKAQKREAMKAMAKRWAMLLLLVALGVTGGLVIGGQLTRIVEPGTDVQNKWVSRGQWVAFGLGILMLVMARRAWMYVVAFLLLGIGGVKISDISRMTDIIPGDQTWENKLPDGKTIIKVVAAPS